MESIKCPRFVLIWIKYSRKPRLKFALKLDFDKLHVHMHFAKGFMRPAELKKATSPPHRNQKPNKPGQNPETTAAPPETAGHGPKIFWTQRDDRKSNQLNRFINRAFITPPWAGPAISESSRDSLRRKSPECRYRRLLPS